MIFPNRPARSLSFHSKSTQVPTNTSNLLAHGAGSPLAEISLLCLGFGNTLGEDSGVLVGSILGLLCVTTLQCNAVALVLQTLGSNQTLDLWCFGIWLLALTLWLNLATNNELANIIILGETKELSDLCSTLGTEALGVNNIGDAGDVAVALLDDAECEDGQIHGDDATTDGFTLTLTGAAGSVAGVTVREEEADTSGVHDSLLHGETLLVVTAGDAEDVTFEFVADAVTWDFSTHSLIHEDAESPLVFDLDELLAAIGRE